MKDKYLTVAEVADMLRISYDTALAYIKTSGIEYVQVGRQYRVLESKLNAKLYPSATIKRKLISTPLHQKAGRR